MKILFKARFVAHFHVSENFLFIFCMVNLFIAGCSTPYQKIEYTSDCVIKRLNGVNSEDERNMVLINCANEYPRPEVMSGKNITDNDIREIQICTDKNSHDITSKSVVDSIHAACTLKQFRADN